MRAPTGRGVVALRAAGRGAVALLGVTLPLVAVSTAAVAGGGAVGGRPDTVVGTSVVGSPTDVSVELDRTVINAGPGEEFTFTSTVRNIGDRPVSGLIAHLNILTSDPDVYVDPEDWSPRRTQYLGELAAGQFTRLTWDIQAVTAGPLIMYVAVTRPGSDDVTVSGPVELTVHGQRVVDAGGVFTLALSVPTAVLGLLALALARRRKHR